MITGYGVSEATKHFYNIHKENLIEKRVIIQGWGNVGAAAAFYLSKLGAKIVGIIDKEGGLINENGFNYEEVCKLFIDKKEKQFKI